MNWQQQTWVQLPPVMQVLLVCEMSWYSCTSFDMFLTLSQTNFTHLPCQIFTFWNNSSLCELFSGKQKNVHSIWRILNQKLLHGRPASCPLTIKFSITKCDLYWSIWKHIIQCKPPWKTMLKCLHMNGIQRIFFFLRKLLFQPSLPNLYRRNV